MGAEEARYLRVDKVNGVMNHLVIVQHCEELFVGVRGSGKALLHFRDVFVGVGKLLRFVILDLGQRGVGGRLRVYSDAIRRGKEHVEARQEIRVALEQQLDTVDDVICGDGLLLELLHDGEEAVVDERAVVKDLAHPLQKLHGVFVLHTARG